MVDSQLFWIFLLMWYPILKYTIKIDEFPHIQYQSNGSITRWDNYFQRWTQKSFYWQPILKKSLSVFLHEISSDYQKISFTLRKSSDSHRKSDLYPIMYYYNNALYNPFSVRRIFKDAAAWNNYYDIKIAWPPEPP